MVNLEDFITAADVAEYFGITERSVNAQRGLPRVRFGKVFVYRKTDIAEWIERRMTRGAAKADQGDQ